MILQVGIGQLLAPGSSPCRPNAAQASKGAGAVDITGGFDGFWKHLLVGRFYDYTWMSQEVRINGSDQWVISPTYKWNILGLQPTS